MSLVSWGYLEFLSILIGWLPLNATSTPARGFFKFQYQICDPSCQDKPGPIGQAYGTTILAGVLSKGKKIVDQDVSNIRDEELVMGSGATISSWISVGSEGGGWQILHWLLSQKKKVIHSQGISQGCLNSKARVMDRPKKRRWQQLIMLHVHKKMQVALMCQ